MPIDYNAMAATATRLLTENGVPMSLRRRQPVSFDSVTGTATENPPQDLPTRGAFQRISTFYQVTARGVGGVMKTDDVDSTDRQIVLDRSQLPQLDDLLVAAGPTMETAVQQLRLGTLTEADFRALLATDGELWQILDVESKTPAGIPVAYIATVRK